MIYFTSDTHFGHKNICRGTSEWDLSKSLGGSFHTKTRDFDTLEEMNKALVNAINSKVKEFDTLYHLGDWSFGGIQNIWEFRKQINCKNIHLIYGNHDHHIEHNREFIIPEKDTEIYEILFEERMGKTKASRTINLQTLFSSCQYYLEIHDSYIHLCLFHYACRVWNKSHKGSIFLHGHSHGTLPEYGSDKEKYKIIDVGVDTKSDYSPYSLNEIIEIMKDRVPLVGIDHHSESTN